MIYHNVIYIKKQIPNIMVYLGKRKPKLLFVINEDGGAISIYLKRLKVVKKKGWDVAVVAKNTGRSKEIVDEGITFIDFPLTRSGKNIFAEIRSIVFLYTLYKKFKPNVIHHATIKPVIYGGIVNRFIGKYKVINSLPGLGHVFSSPKAKYLRPFAELLYRVALHYRKSITVFENEADRDLFVTKGLIRKRNAVLGIVGSVNCAVFKPVKEPTGKPVILLPGRMLWDKGVGEFVQVARLLKNRGVKASFILAGPLDKENPNAIPVRQLLQWQKEGIKWVGNQKKMANLYAKSTIVVFPSYYGEGAPKVLMEAGASGRPVIASSIPGCRVIVSHNTNGLLVQPKNVKELAEAIETLLGSKKLREKFGKAGRRIARKNFSDEVISEKAMHLYDLVLQNNG